MRSLYRNRVQGSGVRVQKNCTLYPVPCTLKRAFTLVEMMVAVAILGIGIALISRSFLNSVSALDSLENRVRAVCFLGSKMGDLEEKSLNDGGIETGQAREEASLGSRKADFRSEINAIDVEGIGDKLNTVKLTLSWTEANKQKEEILVAYLPAKE